MARPQSLTRLRDRAGGRYLPVLLPCPGEMQARHEEARHLLICIAEEQAQAEHVIDHDPRRQQPGPLLYPPGFGQHIIDQVTIDKVCQNPLCQSGQSNAYLKLPQDQPRLRPWREDIRAAGKTEAQRLDQ